MLALKLPVELKSAGVEINFHTSLTRYTNQYSFVGKVSHPFMPSVLSIDGNKICQKVNEILLKKLDCSVELAWTVEGTLAKLATPYEVIFLEICLPDFARGEMLVNLIRHDKRSVNKKTPIIVISSWLEAAFKKKCFSIGVSSIFIKPILAVDFENVLRRHGINFKLSSWESSSRTEISPRKLAYPSHLLQC
ncbi:MAG: response regulator [Pseudomonadota bacterium]